MPERETPTAISSVDQVFVGLAVVLLVLTSVAHGVLLGMAFERAWPQLSRMLASSATAEPPVHVWPILTPILLTLATGGFAWRSQRRHPRARAAAIHAVTVVPWLVTSVACSLLSSAWLTRSRTYAFSRVRGFEDSETENLLVEMILGFFRMMTLGLETAGHIVEFLLDKIAVVALSFAAGFGICLALTWLALRHRLARSRMNDAKGRANNA